MHLKNWIRKKMTDSVLPMPVEVRHAEYSMVLSSDDELSRPSDRLFSIALQAIEAARHISLEPLHKQRAEFPAIADVWPGENYKLLAALVQILRPRQVVEIGTSEGIGALTLRQFLPADSHLSTFDVTPWKAFRHALFTEADFSDGLLVQHLGDLADPDIFSRYKTLLEATDFFFIDGPKDGIMEPKLFKLFETASFSCNPLMVVDDIRLWNMLATWRGISRPKLDLTSFGHWSGTGLIDWNGSIKPV